MTRVIVGDVNILRGEPVSVDRAFLAKY